MVVFEQLSREYGWTTNEIRNMPHQDIRDYIQIVSVRNQIKKYNQMKHGRK
jgi:hypothetical protein